MKLVRSPGMKKRNFPQHPKAPTEETINEDTVSLQDSQRKKGRGRGSPHLTGHPEGEGKRALIYSR